jgi:hypothetical protein
VHWQHDSEWHRKGWTLVHPQEDQERRVRGELWTKHTADVERAATGLPQLPTPTNTRDDAVFAEHCGRTNVQRKHVPVERMLWHIEMGAEHSQRCYEFTMNSQYLYHTADDWDIFEQVREVANVLGKSGEDNKIYAARVATRLGKLKRTLLSWPLVNEEDAYV